MTLNNNQKNLVFIVFFLVLITITIYILRPYFSALFVGALLAYFLYPVYIKIVKKVKSKILAQTILSIGSVLVLLVFLGVIVFPLISQTQLLYQKSEQYISEYFVDGAVCIDTNTRSCQIIRKIRDFTGTKEFMQNSKEFLGKTYSFLFQSIAAVVSSIISSVISLVIIVFSLFYFLDHGMHIKKTILGIIPLQGDHKQQIFEKLRQTINAVVGGNISTALLQGIAGGVIFAILGIPFALFLGLLVAILAFIPAVGATLIWIPVVILLFVKGSIIKGIILGIYSLLVLGYIDNVLKPKLIGDKIKLSSFAIFLGVLGGLQTFGILGLFFGPIIIALLATCINIYQGMDKGASSNKQYGN